MAEKRVVKPCESDSAVPAAELYAAKRKQIADSVREIGQQYDLEIAKIQADFAVFESEHRMEYERHENEFQAALSYIGTEYQSLFQMLAEDEQANEKKMMDELSGENDKYLGIVRDFQTLQNEAFAKYQDLSRLAAAAIDKEAEIHRDFVDGEDARFEDIKRNYGIMNNAQYDKLLWSMERSKNMLDKLTRDLNENAFNDAKFLSQAILQVLETLRDTKNKITSLFKTTTSVYASKKAKIDELSLIRQKPHSVLNQSIIDQFVVQIAAVEKEKASFDRLVGEELEESKTILGKKIIDADARGDRAATEKYIMQYEIVIAKAKFLLNRNRRMSDLLISKYQTEIHKMKVDSFRRVEEIKLAYFMPSQFYQNSINLYSNFAFFINESFDEIDNMLSDFIRINQAITQAQVNYVKTSAKVFEDYKIDLLVTVNAVTAKLSDLITDIDRISKDIISLESKNRLEIAEVKKQMENAEITGDYHKYLKGLEYDRFFADYQFDMNVKAIQAHGDETGQLLSIERKVTASNKENRIDEIFAKHNRTINILEKEIHDQALDKEFVLAEAKFRRDAALIDEQAKDLVAAAEHRTHHSESLFANAFLEQQQNHEQIKTDGSAFVVDFVHETQNLIDLHQGEAKAAKEYIGAADDRYKYAYLLEAERSRMLRELDLRFLDDTSSHRRAIDYYSHFTYVANRHLFHRADRYLTAFGRLLVDLKPETLPLQIASLKLADFYRYEILATFEDAKRTIADIARKAEHPELSLGTVSAIETAFARFTVRSVVVANDKAFERTAAGKRRAVLERFYIESILILRDYESALDVFFDDLLETMITRDVLTVSTAKRKTDRHRAIIENHFDAEVYRAAKTKANDNTVMASIDAGHKEFETTMTDRVIRLNQAYLEGVREEKNRLDYIQKELESDMKGVKRHSKKAVARIEKDRQNAHQAAKIRFDRLVDAYEELKKTLQRNMDADNRAVEEILQTKIAEHQTRLDSLASSIQALPAKKQEHLAALEADKQALVTARKRILEAELSELESLKFNARPMFVAKIQTIRDRLPQDYVDLYKRMAESQEAYIREHRTTEQTFDQAFARFVENQKEYEAIVMNDAVVMNPFDRQIAVADKIIEKTDDAFKDSMAKADATRDLIRKQTVDSEENQKRILNV